ncbi:hypothetical protein LguiB_014136 [Lonicera macranthoides]
MTVFMFVLAFPYHHWTLKGNHIGFVVMYSLTFFFANFGPNATTFVVPTEIFPARIRLTCHGISAAAGKAGAIVGAYGFLYASQNKDPSKTDAGYPPGIGVKNSLIVLGVINFLGMCFTFLVPEPNGKSLEELSGENQDNGSIEPVVEQSGDANNRTVPPHALITLVVPQCLSGSAPQPTPFAGKHSRHGFTSRSSTTSRLHLQVLHHQSSFLHPLDFNFISLSHLKVRIEQIGVKDSESQVQLPPPPAQVQVTPPLIQAQVPPPAPRPNIPRPRGGARRGSRMTRGRGCN